MAKSSFYKWARGLGRLTGKIVEEAKESGLGAPMARAAKKAGAAVREMVEEAKAGAREADSEETNEADEAEKVDDAPEESEAKKDEEISDDEPPEVQEPPERNSGA